MKEIKILFANFKPPIFFYEDDPEVEKAINEVTGIHLVCDPEKFEYLKKKYTQEPIYQGNCTIPENLLYTGATEGVCWYKDGKIIFPKD